MAALLSLLTQEKTLDKGITGFKNKRFYLIAALYLTAFIVFARDPFFAHDGVFVYQQGLVTIFMAFVLAAALNWELMLFGKPSGANFILSILQILPLALFIARITANPSGFAPEPVSITGYAFKGGTLLINGLLGDVFNALPLWLVDIFRNWRITILTIAMMFILSLKNLQFKIGALICLFIVIAAGTVQNGLSINLIAGAILLFAGMYVQFCRYDKILYIENVILRLAGCAGDMTFNSTVLRTAARLEKGEMNRDEFESMTESTPQNAESLLRSMAAKRFIVIKGDSRGFFITPDKTLFKADSLLTSVAVFPRVILTLLFALAWIIMPIDLIPDAIPFIGALDDITVAILSGLVLKNAVVKE